MPGDEDHAAYLRFRRVLASFGDVVEDETVANGPGCLDLDLLPQLRRGRGRDGLQLPASVQERLGATPLLT